MIWLLGATSAHADSEPDPPATGEVQPAKATDDTPTPVEAPGTVAPAPPTPAPPPPAPAPPPKRPTGRFLIGAGFSNDENFIATAEVAQDDLFGTGTQLSLSARISRLRQDFVTRFCDPTLLGTNWGLSAEIYNNRRALPGLDREAAGFSFALSHGIGEHTRAFVGYRLEHVEATDTLSAVARGGEPLPPLGGGLISALRTGVEYSTVDPLERSGARLGASVEVADRDLGSDYNLVRVHGFAQSNLPLGALTLHLYGGVDTVSSGAPRSERLYLDGSTELRGYGPGGIGPIDSLGRPVGGDLKLLGRAELELPLSRKHGISLFGFYDTAAILQQGQGMAGASAGFGLLWRSPIGTLKFSWAVPLDGSKPGFVFSF
ncbi:MAG TPA: BamA/TamA family outer membrane protein [Kofleriaceae bacterium]|nr:BamA/TamA family outer membrane protein [Kofleriaceae bacterium]